MQYVHVQLGTCASLDVSCHTRERVYGLFICLSFGVYTLMQKPKRFAGIVGRQLTLSKRSSTMARHLQSLPRGRSIDPGAVPRQLEDVTSPLGSDVALMQRRSLSVGQTPRPRVGLLRPMSRGQDVSKATKYAVLPMLCCSCCAVWAVLMQCAAHPVILQGLESMRNPGFAEHALQTLAMICRAVPIHAMLLKAVLVHAMLSVRYCPCCYMHAVLTHTTFIMLCSLRLCCLMMCCLMSCQLCCAVLLR